MIGKSLSAIWHQVFTCRIYRIFLLSAEVCLMIPAAYPQEINSYRTAQSGDFPDNSTWEVWNGTSWIAATQKPNQTNDIYIDQEHLVTLTGNEAAKSVFINAEEGAKQKLNLNEYNLDIYGTLQGFTGAAPGTPNRAWNSTDWIGNSFSSTITFKGNSRIIIPKNTWSGQSDRSRYSVIFDPEPNAVLTVEEPFKSLSFTIRSGTVYQKLDISVLPNSCPTFSFNNETTVFGAGPFGDFNIESGATFLTDCNANILFRSASISALNFDLQTGGTLILEGPNPRMESANFQLNGKIIHRGGTILKNFLTSSFTDAATPSSVRDLELQGNQNLRLPEQLTLFGNLEKSGTGNFLTNATTLTLAGSNDQQVMGFPLVIRDLILDKSGGDFYPKGNLTVQRNLTFTQGSMDMEGNDLMINSGLSGELSHSGGSWKNMGQFTYFEIPTILNGTNSTFPFEDVFNGGIRKIQLLGTSVGGNLSINFTEYKGAEYNAGFDDSDATKILYRLFSYFNFSGLSPSANPVELRISADELIVDDVDDLRIVGTGYAAPGNHMAGIDPVELWGRREVTFDDLAGVNFTIGSSRTLSVLPVTWLAVDSKSTSTGNLVIWKVAKEENNLLFEVYRSTNPLNDEWEKVGVVNSLGDYDSPREYQFIDYSAQRFKTNYYRIRQVDFSGEWIWSSVTKIAFQKELLPIPSLILYPNPYISGELNIIIPGFIDPSKAELIIQNSHGKVVVQTQFPDRDFPELLRDLSPGLYLVKVRSERNEWIGKLIRL